MIDLLGASHSHSVHACGMLVAVHEDDQSESDPQPVDARVAAARAGDDAAIADLFEEFGPPLRAALRRGAGARLKRFVEIEDLVQEVHASVIGGLDRLRPDGTAEDFRKILFLHAGWVLGKLGRRASAYDGESVSGKAPVPAAEPPSVGTVTRRDRDAWLAERAESLDEESASVLAGFLAGKTFEEIALGLGVTEDAARMRFLRASARLADTTREEGLR